MADLKYELELDVKGALKGLKAFTKGLDKTDKEMEKVDKSSKSLSKTFGGLKTALVGLVGSLGLGALVKSSLASADALGKVANKTGFTVTALQELRYAAGQANIANNTLDTSLQRFSRRVGEAANGTGVLKKDLQAMQISLKNTDGTMRNIDDVFTEYVRGISNATSEQEKLRLAVAAFDMEGANMVNMLTDGIDGLAGMRREASQLAPLLDEATIKSATQANDAWSKVLFQFKQIATIVAAEMAPAMTHVANAMQSFLQNKEAVGEMRDAFKGISNAIISIVDAFSGPIWGVLFDAGKYTAVALAMRQLGKGFHFLGTVMTGVRGGLTAGGAAMGAMAISAGKLWTSIKWGLNNVGWGALLLLLLDTKETLMDLTGAFKFATGGTNEFFNNLHARAEAFAKSNYDIGDLILSGLGLKDLTLDGRENIPGYIRNEDIDAAKAQAKKLREATKTADPESTKTAAPFVPEVDKSIKKMEDYKNALREAANQFLPLKQLQEEYAVTVDKLGEAQFEGVITQEEYSQALNKATADYQKAKDDLSGLTAESERLKDIQDQLSEAARRTAEAYTPIITQQKKFAKTEMELKRALKDKVLTTKEYQVAMKNLGKEQDAFAKEQLRSSKKWSDGWKVAMDDYVENARNAAQQAGDIFRTLSQGWEDAIVGFAKTGKFEWKSFADDIITQMLRIESQKLFANLFGGGTSAPAKSSGSSGGLIGGLIGGVKKLFGGFFAEGGHLPAGKFGIVGERGPEMINGPANITPMDNMSSNVTYNINAVDAQSFKQMVAQDPTFLFAVTEQGRRSLPNFR